MTSGQGNTALALRFEPDQSCAECGAAIGELHAEMCSLEMCPICGDSVAMCEHGRKLGRPGDEIAIPFGGEDHEGPCCQCLACIRRAEIDDLAEYAEATT